MDDAQTIELGRNELSPILSPERERGLEEALLRPQQPARLKERLTALWTLWLQNHPELQEARAVSFYRDTLSTIPGAARRPLRRELLLVLPLDT